jgi:DNA repair protein SbcD/Mre11
MHLRHSGRRTRDGKIKREKRTNDSIYPANSRVSARPPCYNQGGMTFPSLFDDNEEEPLGDGPANALSEEGDIIAEDVPDEPEAVEHTLPADPVEAVQAVAAENAETFAIAPEPEPPAVAEQAPTPTPLPRVAPPHRTGTDHAAAKSVRVMHFGDVHLGVENYGKYNPETGLNTRLEDFTRALNDAVEMALAQDVDIAIFAGDAYKARDPNQTHQRAFASALKRLTDVGVPVALLVGNHDIPNTRGRAHALEIYGLLGGAGVTILAKPEVATLTTRKGDVLVAGMPYLTRSRVLTQEEARGKSVEEVAHLIRDKYVTYLAELAQSVAERPDAIALLTGHFTVADARVGTQNFLMNPNEPQVSVNGILYSEPSPWDYVAMGHVHKFQDMHKGNQPPVIYCGSIDRIDFGERTEQKGFVIADVRKGHASFAHVPLKTRPFLSLDVDAGNADDPTKAIIEEIGKHPIAGAVVRMTYKVPPDRAALVRMDEVRKALAPAHILVALSREMPPAEALVRSQAFSDAMTPEKALSLYLELQPRLVTRKDELLAAARPLFDALEQEEALR